MRIEMQELRPVQPSYHVWELLSQAAGRQDVIVIDCWIGRKPAEASDAWSMSVLT